MSDYVKEKRQNGRTKYRCILHLLNDKISQSEASKATWRRVKKLFPHDTHFNSYPAIKIGRFAVNKQYEGHSIGSKLMLLIKDTLSRREADSAFRFLTVDAYYSQKSLI